MEEASDAEEMDRVAKHTAEPTKEVRKPENLVSVEPAQFEQEMERFTLSQESNAALFTRLDAEQTERVRALIDAAREQKWQDVHRHTAALVAGQLLQNLASPSTALLNEVGMAAGLITDILELEELVKLLDAPAHAFTMLFEALEDEESAVEVAQLLLFARLESKLAEYGQKPMDANSRDRLRNLLRNEEVRRISQQPSTATARLVALAARDEELVNSLARPLLCASLEKPLIMLLRDGSPSTADASALRKKVLDAIACVTDPRLVCEIIDSSTRLSQDVAGSGKGGAHAFDVARFALLVLPTLGGKGVDLAEAFLQGALIEVLQRLTDDEAITETTKLITEFVHALPLAATRQTLLHGLTSPGSPSQLLAQLLRAWSQSTDVASLKDAWTPLKPSVRKGLEAMLSQHLRNLGVSDEATEGIVQQIADEMLESVRTALPQLATVFVDPAALGVQLGSMLSRLSTRKTELVERVVMEMALHALKSNLGDDDLANRICGLLKQESTMTLCSLGQPQMLAAHLLQMCKEAAKDEKAEQNDELLRCAKVVVVQWVVVRLRARGADARVVWLAREVIKTRPLHLLEEALRDPDKLMQQVLQEAVDAGMEFAEPLLEDAMTHARDAAVAQLTAAGLSAEHADVLINAAQAAATNPEQTLQEATEVSIDDVLDRFKQQLASASTASALAMFAFFLRGRLLPLYDMVSDLFVAAEICSDGSSSIVASLGQLFTLSCSFGGDPLSAPVQRVFFVLVVIFFCATWCVLWLVLAQVIITEASEAAEKKKVEDESDRLAYMVRWILVRAFGFSYQSYDERLFLVRDQSFRYDVFHDFDDLIDNFAKLSLVEKMIAPPVCTLAFLLIDAPSWLIGAIGHGVLALSRRALGCTIYDKVGEGAPEPFVMAARLVVGLMGVMTLPLGVPLLLLIEIGTLILLPTTPVQTPFGSSYENLKRFLEPSLESWNQSLTQLAYLLWGFFALNRSFDTLIFTSLITSIAQLLHTYHYVRELSRAYRKSFLGILRELLLLSSLSYVPYRLVMRSWKTVDFGAVPGLLTAAMWQQIGDALI